MINISIIIIVKDDIGIKTTLSYLSKEISHRNDVEILVVDSSNGLLNSIRTESKYTHWINFNNINNRSITIPHQRNLGIQKSKGNIIVFIDASCIPSKGWLNVLTKPIIEKQEVIVCGSTGSINSESFRNQILSSNIKKKYLHEAPTINLALSKIVINKIGIFDENFDYGSDVDFTWRAVQADFRILYKPEAYIEHEWGSFSNELKRSFRYGRARVKLYIKHKKTIQKILTNDIIVLIYPLYIVFIPIGFYFPIYFLLLLIPLYRNYKYKPVHTLIDHLVYGLGVLYEIIKIFIKIS